MCIFFSGIIYIIGFTLYLKALNLNDTSLVVILLGLIPVFSFVLSYLLFKETLTIRQIVGAVTIIISASALSLGNSSLTKNEKIKVFVLMIFSSFFQALYYVLFDIGTRYTNFNNCSFYFQITLIIIGIFFLSIRSFRVSFVSSLKGKSKKIVGLNLVNEVLNLLGNTCVNYANLFIPIALANVLTGFQGIFAFIIGSIGMISAPAYFCEDISRDSIIQKVSSAILSIIGLIIMFS